MLRVLCRTKAQVEAALQVPWLGEVVLDFLEVRWVCWACWGVLRMLGSIVMLL